MDTTYILTDLCGKFVTAWNLDFDTKITFSGGDDNCGLTMDKFSLFVDGKQFDFQDPTKASVEMNQLIGNTVKTAFSDEIGNLHIEFDNNLKLICWAAVKTEAWEFRWVDKTVFALPAKRGVDILPHAPKFMPKK